MKTAKYIVGLIMVAAFGGCTTVGVSPGIGIG